ncbi:MAG: hypothetical protein H9Q67_06255, partial [Spiroplasma ixodetis]|nr:hypothetical protein [Spiroplasma ixodetis]
IKETNGKYMLYNTDNSNETIGFDYKSGESLDTRPSSSSDNRFTESKANITFVINHKKSK